MPAVDPEILKTEEFQKRMAEEVRLRQEIADNEFELMCLNGPVTIAPRNITVNCWDPTDEFQRYSAVFIGKSRLPGAM